MTQTEWQTHNICTSRAPFGFKNWNFILWINFHIPFTCLFDQENFSLWWRKRLFEDTAILGKGKPIRVYHWVLIIFKGCYYTGHTVSIPHSSCTRYDILFSSPSPKRLSLKCWNTEELKGWDNKILGDLLWWWWLRKTHNNPRMTQDHHGWSTMTQDDSRMTSGIQDDPRRPKDDPRMTPGCPKDDPRMTKENMMIDDTSMTQGWPQDILEFSLELEKKKKLWHIQGVPKKHMILYFGNNSTLEKARKKSRGCFENFRKFSIWSTQKFSKLTF